MSLSHIFPPRVLVVDDRPGLLGVYSRFLQQAGFKVLATTTAKDALDIVRAEKLPLALVDVHLAAGECGYDLCRNIREWVSTEVFLMSATLTDPADMLRGYQEGCVRFFVKPASALTMVRMVQEFFYEPRPLMQTAGAGSPALLVQESPANVLLIEDDEEMGPALGLHLEQSGLTPYLVRSGGEGIMRACTLRPQAVVLDIGLPDIDGESVLKILRTSPRTKDIPIVIWTACRVAGLEARFLKDGAVHFCVKGVNDITAVPVYIKDIISRHQNPSVLRQQPIGVDLATQTVRVFDRVLDDFTPGELRLLSHLVNESPRVIPWAELEQEVRGIPAEVAREKSASAALEMLLNRLRAKLGKAAVCIVTHRGTGLQYNPAKV